MIQKELAEKIFFCQLFYYQHFLQASYPWASASAREICLALFGFIFPQSGMLWYFDPVADNHTVSDCAGASVTSGSGACVGAAVTCGCVPASDVSPEE